MIRAASVVPFTDLSPSRFEDVKVPLTGTVPVRPGRSSSRHEIIDNQYSSVPLVSAITCVNTFFFKMYFPTSVCSDICAIVPLAEYHPPPAPPMLEKVRLSSRDNYMRLE
ncbi:hypothetical protein GEV33_003039 [Tenebrio molitor]|uniref:Uncharacterized protein n=1 Tax=Tenebrio molitor TaxID=7067 RepID=A0A8J6HSC1_TENMO|nr:hypothetical protein GEV33_003039 [Tenebrio molitor]